MLRFQTELNKTQIRDKLNELELPFVVKWHHQKNVFWVARKRDDWQVKVPANCVIKGSLEEKDNVTEIILSIAPLAMIKKFLAFYFIPTTAIMLYAGTKIGAALWEIFIMLGVTTAFFCVVVNLVTKFSSVGKDLCYETINMIKLQLDLIEK